MGIFTDESFLALQNKLLVIHPMTKKSITAVGYDLRIGFYAQMNRRRSALEAVGEVKDGESPTISLPPDRYLVVVSREYVFLSCRVAATFHSKSSLAAQGIFLNSTTGDPNWCGRLIFLLYNASGATVELELDHTFTTMVVQDTERRGVTQPVDSLRVLRRYMKGFDGPTNAQIFEYVSRDDSEHKDFLARAEKARRFAARPYPLLVVSLWMRRVVDAIGVPVALLSLLALAVIVLVMNQPQLFAKWFTDAQLTLVATLLSIGSIVVPAVTWVVKTLNKKDGANSLSG